MKLFTPRLELVTATLEMILADLHARDRLPALVGARIGAGWPAPLVDVNAMERLKLQLTNEPDPQGWGAWYVLNQEPRELIGLCGFKSRPRDRAVEFGYSLLETHQGQGLGTELVAGLIGWAFLTGDVDCVFAETLPELAASQRVLIKNGFVRAAAASEPGVLRFEKRRPATQVCGED